MKKEKTRFIDIPEIIKWCYEGVTDVSIINRTNKSALKKSAVAELCWGNKAIGNKANSCQWTTKLCQELVKEALVELGRKHVRKVIPKKSSVRDKRYQPDLECDDFVYEVKGRNWCTPGTAGEKILGVPLKYGELPKLYKKPLRIILVGYQEYEARKSFAFGDLLDKNNQTIELQNSLKFFKKNKIEYIAFTDILKEIGFEYGCWNNK